MAIREILSERKTFILKEPLIRRLRLRGNPDGNPDNIEGLIEKYIIKEKIPVPGPEVKRIYV